MVYQVVAVRDAAMEAFGRPFFVAGVQVAVRTFMDEVLRKQGELTDMQRHPEHFDLYWIGSFDDSLGLLKAKEMPELLSRGSELKEK